MGRAAKLPPPSAQVHLEDATPTVTLAVSTGPTHHWLFLHKIQIPWLCPTQGEARDEDYFIAFT